MKSSDVIEDSILWIDTGRHIPALQGLNEADKIRLLKLLSQRREDGIKKYGKPLGYSSIEKEKLINQSVDSFIYSYQTRDSVLIHNSLTTLVRAIKVVR